MNAGAFKKGRVLVISNYFGKIEGRPKILVIWNEHIDAWDLPGRGVPCTVEDGFDYENAARSGLKDYTGVDGGRLMWCDGWKTSTPYTEKCGHVAGIRQHVETHTYFSSASMNCERAEREVGEFSKTEKGKFYQPHFADAGELAKGMYREKRVNEPVTRVIELMSHEDFLEGREERHRKVMEGVKCE